jgi:hypothetical protein
VASGRSIVAESAGGSSRTDAPSGPSPFGAPDLTLLRSIVVLNQADGGAAGAGGSAGLGQGGGVYVTAGSTACAHLVTAILANHASASGDDVFGDLSRGC